jgi:hypothetical protein
LCSFIVGSLFLWPRCISHCAERVVHRPTIIADFSRPRAFPFPFISFPLCYLYFLPRAVLDDHTIRTNLSVWQVAHWLMMAALPLLRHPSCVACGQIFLFLCRLRFFVLLAASFLCVHFLLDIFAAFQVSRDRFILCPPGNHSFSFSSVLPPPSGPIPHLVSLLLLSLPFPPLFNRSAGAAWPLLADCAALLHTRVHLSHRAARAHRHLLMRLTPLYVNHVADTVHALSGTRRVRVWVADDGWSIM